MKKLSLFLCSYFLMLLVVAQTPSPKMDSVLQLMRKAFNEKSANALYALTGSVFKKAISVEQFTAIGQNNLFSLGQMPEPKFMSTTNGVNKYKIDFDAASLTLYLSLDSQDKIQTFLFKPYVDETPKATKAATSNHLQSSMDKQVDAAVQPYISLAATAGVSIGVIKDGKTSYYQYGETEKGLNHLPTEHTLYEIGSITKTFTALLLADAVVKGRLKLDDPVNTYLPSTVPKLVFEGVPVTVKMLANHTSGLPGMPDNFAAVATDEKDPYKNYSSTQLLQFYKNFKLARKPGTAYEYSNLGVATLGWILERVNKKPFAVQVQELITSPLGMKETRITLTKKDSSTFAKGYSESGQYNGPWNLNAFAPAGGLRSTITDMLVYAKAAMDLASPSLYKAIELTQTPTFTNGNTKLGLAWHYIKPGADELLFHNGGTGGFSSYLAIDKSKKLAVVVLSNCALITDEVGNKLIKALAEL